MSTTLHFEILYSGRMENWSTLPTYQGALRFFGLWHTDTSSPLNFCRTAAIVGLHVYYITYFAILLLWQGKDKLLYSCSYIIIAVTALHRVMMVSVRKKQILELCGEMEENYKSMEHGLHTRVSSETHGKIKTFSKSYLWRQCAVMSFWCTGYLISILYDFYVKRMPYAQIKKELPFGVPYSFEWETSPVFELLFISEMLQIMLIIYSISISDCALFTILAHICGQLQALVVAIQLEGTKEHTGSLISDVQTVCCKNRKKPKILMSVKSSEKYMGMLYTTSGKKMNCSCKAEQFLHRVINHHTQIYRFADSFEEMCGTMLYIKFLVTTFFLCLTTYMISISLDSPGSICRFVSWALYEIIILYNYCYLGEKLTSWSLRVNDVLFYQDWHDKSALFKKTCWIMMVRAQRPIILKAGAFYTLSFQSFRKILESSYSYLMVLLQINKKFYNKEYRY